MILIVGLVWGFIQYKKQVSNKFGLGIPLVKDGIQLRVDFEDCEIKSKKFYEEAPANKLMPTKMEILDGIYNSKNDTDKVEKEVSVILYRHTKGDKIVEYRSNPIYLPGITLRHILEEKGSTFIYIDPQNPNRYFFDVGFLY